MTSALHGDKTATNVAPNMGSMKHRIAVVALLLLATAASASDELAGLWSAKKRFGPDARGTLIILRSGNRYTADFEGRRIAVTSSNGELSFALPDRGGDFRGRRDAHGAITGHWYRYGTPVNGFGGNTPVGASLVRLAADGANRWRGNVDPVQDTFTFFLLLRKRDDGSFSALLRNPEFDLGS